MKIVIDINHTAHINFFKNTIIALSQAGHEIKIYGLMRGKLPAILKYEFKGYDISFLAKHRGSILSIIFEANILKFFKILTHLIKERPDFGLSVGGFVFGACMKLLRKPNIQFDDDPESSQNIFFEKITATEIHVPSFVNTSNRFISFNCLKEWAYLSPKYFTPSLGALQEYGLQVNKYIFIREVSSGSLNYKNRGSFNILSFANKLDSSFKVLFSLEDKSKRHLYPDAWITINEPAREIHSLMYYSILVISSGDSMAREGALLGKPSIYCGKRIMKANDVLIAKKMLLQTNPKNIPDLSAQIVNGELKFNDQEKYRDKLLMEWDDVTEHVLNIVKKFEVI